MDRLAVTAGAVVSGTTGTVAILRVGTPEAVLAAMLLAGVLTGAGSRAFQSEFRDAFFAGVLGFAGAVTLVAFPYGGLRRVNGLVGGRYNVGLLVWLGALGFSLVPGLVSAVGGEAGARLRRAVSGRVGGD